MFKKLSWITTFEEQSSLSKKPIISLLIGLILIDLVIIALNFYNAWVPDEQWTEFLALASDDSIGEYFQYLKWFFISAAFIYIAIHRSSYSFLAWFLLFLYLLFDDSLSLHENIGGQLMNSYQFDTPMGLRMQDLGELLVSAIAGSILLLVFIVAYIKGSEFFKITTFNMLYLFIALVFFGVFFDVIAVMIYGGNPTLAFLFDVIEDGGEMFVASFMTWYSLLIVTADKRPISLISMIQNLFKSKMNHKFA